MLAQPLGDLVIIERVELREAPAGDEARARKRPPVAGLASGGRGRGRAHPECEEHSPEPVRAVARRPERRAAAALRSILTCAGHEHLSTCVQWQRHWRSDSGGSSGWGGGRGGGGGAPGGDFGGGPVGGEPGGGCAGEGGGRLGSGEPGGGAGGGEGGGDGGGGDGGGGDGGGEQPAARHFHT